MYTRVHTVGRLVLGGRSPLLQCYKVAVRKIHFEKTIPSLPLFQRALKFKNNTVVVDIDTQEEHTYTDLLVDSARLADTIAEGAKDLQEKRVSFIAPATYDYVRTQWAIWRAGGVAVPLCTTHPANELEHVLKDSQSTVLVASKEFTDLVKPLAEKLKIKLLPLDAPKKERALQVEGTQEIAKERKALIIYTSGTTGLPKGVVTTHAALDAQVTSLVEAWEWKSNDRILNVLPLHHVHGVVNVVTCALYSGAICEMMPKFDANKVWGRFMNHSIPPLSLFMAVPTIYSRLIHAYEGMPPDQQKEAKSACGKMRLMVSGSAALPTPTLEKWKEISGHTLLERYGMTEIGMALSNPLHEERIPGTVGFPLPGVQVRIVDGELRVKGPQVFREYLNKPDATKATFDEEGWFKTGDIAEKDEKGRYKILGRASVDIIKSGGYKISALDIERVLLEHPSISDVAVVGVPSIEWGQVIGALIVTRKGTQLNLHDVQEFAKARLAPYKIPRIAIFKDEIPKNAMGKVQKKHLLPLFPEHK